jgi:hypothetical protein
MDDGLETTTDLGELLHGALELETTDRGVIPHRLPAWAREYADAQLTMAESQPSGVRLAFRTRATTIEVEAVATKRVYTGTPPRPDGIYDLIVDGTLAAQASVPGGDTLTIDMMSGSMELTRGPAGSARFTGLSGEPKEVEIWLPHDETTELVALRADAPLEPVPAGRRPRWLHHGSSISQGSNASHPTGTWPAVASGRADLDLLNLGYGGSAMLDPFVARVIRDTPADLISLELGINIVNGDVMRLRAFAPAVHGFLDTIRDGHPHAPLLVLSPFYGETHEATPGPSFPDLSTGQLRFVASGDPAEVAAGKLTLEVVRAELAQVVEQRSPGDPRLHLVDGLSLYGEADAATDPLPDGLHPGGESHRLIGERFGDLVARDYGFTPRK